jgi:hypothetical protein
MSVQGITWAYRQPDLSTGAKSLLVAIANCADASGVGFPGRERLAFWCACTPATISANLKQLERAGLVARFPRRRRNGSRTSDWIVLAPLARERAPLLDADPDEYPEDVAAAARQGSSDSLEQNSLHKDDAPGQVKKTGGPEPSVEPSGVSTDVETTAIGENRTTATEQGEVDERALAQLPPDLRPLVELVRRELLEVAEAKSRWNAVPPTVAEVASVLGDERLAKRDFIPGAERFRDHHIAHPERQLRDVIGSYRRWLECDPDVLRKTQRTDVDPHVEETHRRLEEAMR